MHHRAGEVRAGSAVLQNLVHAMALKKTSVNTIFRAYPLALLCCLMPALIGCSGTALQKNFSMQTSRQAPHVTNSLGMSFAFVPAGSFQIGSTRREPGEPADETPAAITITRGFFLQTTEVTQEQWEAVMHNNPSFFSECGKTCPVERVSWDECIEFIGKLNDLEGTDSYRLPTEAEWEYACKAEKEPDGVRGTLADPACFKDPYLDKTGWYCSNSGGTTHPVGEKEPNTLGIYDMHGNVYEWCQDWYGPYPEGPASDYTGPAQGEAKVMRGGAYCYLSGHCRSSHRRRHSPNFRNKYLGFRLAKNP
jgi:formylglycine-generating enzyme required for sulfatase activity